MFTGIVEAVGRIASRETRADGVRIHVDVQGLDIRDVRPGDSIAVGGCCLTVVGCAPPRLEFDVSPETLACTTGFAYGAAVNLERALRLSDRLGGHLVSGHVDGVGRVASIVPSEPRQGNRSLAIAVHASLARYIAAKGSVAVDGVSLTTNTVEGERFTVNLIPHTLAVTTLGNLRAGSEVNIEVDLIARYVERLRDRQWEGRA